MSCRLAPRYIFYISANVMLYHSNFFPPVQTVESRASGPAKAAEEKEAAEADAVASRLPSVPKSDPADH
jgi:hypothetical protein